jgi:hypothetical protein
MINLEGKKLLLRLILAYLLFNDRYVRWNDFWIAAILLGKFRLFELTYT